jgi:segregation and condensation protein B
VTVPEISEIRGVDSAGVIATLLDRKLITTAGRKAVIGRPILYKTSKEFLLRFGLKDVHELPSMEEFEKLLAESFQSDLIPGEAQSEAANTEAAESEAELPAVDDSVNEPPEPASQADGVAETPAAETDYSSADTSSGDTALEEKRNAS